MTSRKAPLTLIVFGSLLALGPLWGVVGTVAGMLRAFDTVRTPDLGASEQLAGDVGVSLWAAAAGLSMVPIGLALLIGGIVWLVKLNKKDRAPNPQQTQTIAAKRDSV